ncbi:hypothetical protein HZS_4254 [Henneguya salminicola]|nr:hypothetical protein HZS_4254 [Henneguya salminicola]
MEYCDFQTGTKKCYNGANDTLTCENKNLIYHRDICNNHGSCKVEKYRYIRLLKTKFIVYATPAIVGNTVMHMCANLIVVEMGNVRGQIYAIAILFITEIYATNTYAKNKQNLIVQMTISAITQIIQLFVIVTCENFKRTYVGNVNVSYSANWVSKRYYCLCHELIFNKSCIKLISFPRRIIKLKKMLFLIVVLIFIICLLTILHIFTLYKTEKNIFRQIRRRFVEERINC